MTITQSSQKPAALLLCLQSYEMHLLLQLFQTYCLAVFLCLSKKWKQSQSSALTDSHTSSVELPDLCLSPQTWERVCSHIYREVCMCVQAICGGLCAATTNKSLVQWDIRMRLSASDVVTVTPTGWEIYRPSCQRETNSLYLHRLYPGCKQFMRTYWARVK